MRPVTATGREREANQEVASAVEHEPGPADPAVGEPGSRITDPEGPASFLDAVRTLVHGETVAAQRTDSDSWEPPAGAVAEAPVTEDVTVPDDVDGPEPRGDVEPGREGADWLPGHWVEEPAGAAPRPGRRRRAEPLSEKSAKSGRGRRSGRTVDEATRRGASGAEVQMAQRQHAPDLEPADEAEAGAATTELGPPPKHPLSGRARRRESKARTRAEQKEAKARAKVEREAAARELKQERTASRTAAAAERAATKVSAAERRHQAKEQAVLDRAAALAAKAEAKNERDTAKARARAERQAATTLSTPATPAEPELAGDHEPVLSQADAEHAVPTPPSSPAPLEDVPADVQTEPIARPEPAAHPPADRETVEANARAEREAAAEQARLERDAVAVTKAEATAERGATKARARAQREAEATRVKAERRAGKAARARDRAEQDAEAEQARVDRMAADALASVARAKQRYDDKRQRAAAKAEAAIARTTAKAEAKVGHATAKARSQAGRAAARAQRRLDRAAAKAQRQVDRAGARADVKAERAAARTREASEVDIQVVAADAATESARPEERLADYVARVESGRTRTTGAPLPTVVKVALVAAVVAACAVVPWAAPSVPRFFADLVPGGNAAAPHVQDPPVEPAPSASVAPDQVLQQSSGLSRVRLKSAGPPREVSVPRLHVDSEVIPISGQSGSLLPPSDPQQLGWWREGQPAGAQYGSAVVTGHTVHTGGGALDHLDKLVVGDAVRVRTDAGWIRYVVQRTQIYSTAQLARDADQIFTHGGPGRLVLITCDDWNGQFYESNAVVFAAPVADEPSAATE